MVDPAVPLFSKVGFSKSWKPGKADNRRFAQRSQEPGTRSKELIEKQIDGLARQFATTHDMKINEEIERLAPEYESSKSCGGSWRSEQLRVHANTHQRA